MMNSGWYVVEFKSNNSAMMYVCIYLLCIDVHTYLYMISH